ncbi:carbamoyltransferase HypF [Phaeovibrio sulfidiphilus]|uniref:acylphosphatase n=1 Tax=Phaeovibrio sulfidiphilus TaxID=1220600 RepID=A0A8J6YLB4_9PROT|nr:Sua5/YciO/YrdC/YwlC family protein [Phaeovibrio sulfidiphilus]MBE1236485.1 carbamoyltransferase HypF [Phaeovibrio sulfidiphilus]
MSRRLRVTLSGRVQGVGFRPFVYRLAVGAGLGGEVRNTPRGLDLEIQGEPAALETFLARLRNEAPEAARIDALDVQPVEPRSDAGSDPGSDPAAHGAAAPRFVISASGAGERSDPDGVDRASCPDCLAEMFDPDSRRWRYPFTACTACGPRYTVETRRPWAREGTVFADFPLCDACRAEFLNPSDRRFHAETLACPECGPRYALEPVSGPPVGAVAGPVEADAPGSLKASRTDTRTPAVCPVPGAGAGATLPGAPVCRDAARDPFAAAWGALDRGGIVAFRGTGGFHLLCDARNPDAVRRLRSLKAREARPFALMVLNTASARALVRFGPHTAALLESPRRPVVLSPRRPDAPPLEGVAPDSSDLGLLLPPTGAHVLLFHEALARQSGAVPTGSAWLEAPFDRILVCTSANLHNEPILTGASEIRRVFGEGIDCLVTHDRPVPWRIDDSVLRDGACPDASGVSVPDVRSGSGCDEDPSPGPSRDAVLSPFPSWDPPAGPSSGPRPGPGSGPGEHPVPDRSCTPSPGASTATGPAPFPASDPGWGARWGAPVMIRRARGYVWEPVPLAHGGPAVLALGPYRAATQCLVSGERAFVSRHLGTLSGADALLDARATARFLGQRLAEAPVALACDLHEDYPSTRLARDLGREWGLPVLAVQHHHAHIAAVAAENRHTGPLFGLALDGAGLGTDGTVWGGELLAVEPDGTFQRRGFLHPFPLPGGDRAAREPWRMAVSVLWALGREDEAAWRFPHIPEAPALARLVGKPGLWPVSSSLGRLFDAAAALLGVCTHQSFDGQAAMALESLACDHGPVSFDVAGCEPGHGYGHGPGCDWGGDGPNGVPPVPLMPSTMAPWTAPAGVLPEGLPLVPFGVRPGDPSGLSPAPAPAPVSATATDGRLSLLPLFARLLDEPDPARGSALFHAGLVRALADWCGALCGPGATVALGGGCFVNRILGDGLAHALECRNIRPLRAALLPPNDGGLSLGQAVVVRQRLEQEGR